ncbi:MAG: cadmium-translocating P-type ATPase [Candidatus Woesearchaeota archaeon]|nr:cadmium-translocating P-type ATPase [Candidatus Woesearchaeota archaeon]
MGNKCCSSCSSDEEQDPSWKKKKIVVIVVSGILLLAGLYLEQIMSEHSASQVIFFLVTLFAGYQIIKKGLASAMKFRFDMNFLMSLAAFGAFIIGEGAEGASVMFLYFLAEFLEEYAAERSRKSIGALLNLTPETAIILRDGKETKVHVQEIKIGDILVVKPGDKIPIDGVVSSGSSSINQASITGESMPASKKIGDEVFAGTINEEGYLEIKATKASNQTVLSKIIKLVENAEKEKSKTEIFIDRFARYYTPIVILISVLVFVVPVFILKLPFETWFYRSLVLLVVSCPCALAISTPVSMVSAITSAAKNGVLIKGGSYIEEMKTVKVIVFDKTGTLTEGKPEVTDVISLNKHSEKELLEIAASLESKSNHPIAQAISAYSNKNGVKKHDVEHFHAVSGKGLHGNIKGRYYHIGKSDEFLDSKLKTPKAMIEKLEDEGKTAVIIASKDHVVGIIAVMDKLRETAGETISNLKKRGLRTVMLTGDNERVAHAISEKIGIDEHYAGLLPEEKVKKIDEFLEKYECVAMVGDGVNDAPALAKAHVGIAMGAIGSDVAIETADIALMHDDLSKVEYLVSLSNKTLLIVKQNIFISIIVKGSFAILAFPGLVPLWLAVAAGDMGLSLIVIGNALRIGKK